MTDSQGPATMTEAAFPRQLAHPGGEAGSGPSADRDPEAGRVRRRVRVPAEPSTLTQVLDLSTSTSFLIGNPLFDMHWLFMRIMDYRKQRAARLAGQEVSDARVPTPYERMLLCVHLFKAMLSLLASVGVPLGFAIHWILGKDLPLGYAIVSGLAIALAVIAVGICLNWRRFKAVFPEIFGNAPSRDMTL
mmetsp:Transcript_144382/g.254561  ORF Transcript_144382/g.254561 Transcript_144382/m.254561 type:complete len:190 (-) Transcript_144382:88-657(-)